MNRPARRREDPPLLRGEGAFVADLASHALHAAILRSPHAHARIRAVHAAGARRSPEVALVLTAADIEAWAQPLATLGTRPEAIAGWAEITARDTPRWPLAKGRVVYVGQPVAVVVAADRYRAEDALERIDVEYDPLPATVDPEAALAVGAPRVHDAWPDNVAIRVATGVGDAEAALAAADCVVGARLRFQRQTGTPIETRGVLAAPTRPAGGLTVWSSCQMPHALRDAIAEQLALPASRVRVVAPDVGGGFGTKAGVYEEEVLIAAAAWRLRRAVGWVEDRRESFAGSLHARDQLHEARLGCARDGTILGIADRILVDNGAYVPWGVGALYNTLVHLPGPYRVPHYRVEGRCVVTNKVPAAPYRGAGRPEAVFVMERLLDLAARRLGLDPLDVRRRNLVGAGELPYDTGLRYKDGGPVAFDSGDFPAAFERALQAVGAAEVRRRQVSLAEAGNEQAGPSQTPSPGERSREARNGWTGGGGARRGAASLVGVGAASFVEGTGLGPFEGATVRVEASGRVHVATGAASQGQGHRTVLAALCADVLGVDPERVEVVCGDTAAIPYGMGAYASRQAVNAGNAVAQAAASLKEQIRDLAARALEVDPRDVEDDGDRYRVRGAPQRGLTLSELAQLASPGGRLARLDANGLEATRYFQPATVAYAHAAHAAVVSVDPGTGEVRLLRYAVAHDCGRALDEAAVAGQILGGVAQGVGGALFEALAYDAQGQPLVGTLADYLLPTAAETPRVELIDVSMPTRQNPLGIKGVGESGTIGTAAAVASAVHDALSALGGGPDATPLKPDALWALIAAGRPD